MEKIFEGDQVEFIPVRSASYTGVVVWNTFTKGFTITTENGEYFLMEDCDRYKVIGGYVHIRYNTKSNVGRVVNTRRLRMH